MGTDELTNRRAYLGVIGAGLIGTAGCVGGDSGTDSTGDDSNGDDSTSDGSNGDTTGTLATQVSDQPGDIDDFESCVVNIVGYWLGPAADATDTAETDDSTPNATDTDDEQTDADDEQTDADDEQTDTDDGQADTDDGQTGRAGTRRTDVLRVERASGS